MTGDLVLLTGATGFVGSRVLTELLVAGYTVRAAVRNASGFEKIKGLQSVAPYKSRMESIIVTDITRPKAYDDAVQGVKYIVHVASPFASSDLFDADYELAYIQPAINGTIGMLDSARKVTSVERIVITASILSIAAFDAPGTVINESHRRENVDGPYPNWRVAYAASKARAFEASKEWMNIHKPAFDLINIEPGFVLGRDETIEAPQGILKGSNGSLMRPVLGTPSERAYPGIPVHVADVAMMHVRALDPAIPGNDDYLAISHPFQGAEWADAFDIIRTRYPKECSEGVFKVNTMERPKTTKFIVDSTKAEKTFGFSFKTFEDQVLEVAEHYLELLQRK